MEEEKREYIDLRKVYKRIVENKRKFFITLPIVFVVACLYTLCLPRFYESDTMLVPEMDNSSSMGGTLGDMASLIGLDLSSMSTTDAITPLLYPDLMNDNGFVADLFHIKVKSEFDEDMPIDTTYYAYMRKFQKMPFWTKWINSAKNAILPTPKKFIGSPDNTSVYDPYCVSEDDYSIMEKIRKNISIGIDKKTAVISVSVKAQDPYICRQLADSVKELLQIYITEYRTNKVRTDVEYYKELMDNAKVEYDSARIKYALFMDTNRGTVSNQIRCVQSDLENDMQFKYNTYTTICTQYQANLAKLQARTPVFTTLKAATVPVKHSGPKRMFIVLGFLVFASFSISVLVLKDDILKQLNRKSV